MSAQKVLELLRMKLYLGSSKLLTLFNIRFKFIFLSFLLVVCSAHSFSISQYGNLTAELKVHLRTVCWFLLSNEMLESQRNAVKFHRQLALDLHIKVSHIPINNLYQIWTDFHCQDNRPMVVLFAGEATRSQLKVLHKIPSYPRWLLFLEASTPALTEYFEDVFVPFDCEFLVAENLGSEVRLTEIYRVAEGLRLNARHFGTWSPEQGLVATKTALYERRRDLEGIVLKGLSMEYIPELFIIKGINQSKQQVSGLYGMIWTSMQTLLNFTTQLVEVGFGEFGALKNGTWQGMITSVIDKEVDVGLNGFTYDVDRLTAVDYLTPILLSRARLFVLKPTTSRSQWHSFLSPFSASLWVGILGAVFASGVSLSASNRLGRRHGVEARHQEDLDLPWSLFHVFGLYCTQDGDGCTCNVFPGCSAGPRAASSRGVLLLAGFTSTVVVAAYSGALTSALTASQPELAHQSIAEYVADPAYDLEMSPNAFWIYINRPRNNLLRGIYKRMAHKVEDMPMRRLDGVKKLCETVTPYAWFATKNIENRYLQELNCEIVAVPGHLVVNTESMIVPKGSPYKRVFNNYVNFLRSAGILEHMHQLTWPDSKNNVEQTSPVVQLQEVLPTFGVLLAGLASSLLLFTFELSYMHKLQRS